MNIKVKYSAKMSLITLLTMCVGIAVPMSHAEDAEPDKKPAHLVRVEDELLKSLKHTVHGFSCPKKWKNAIKVPISVTTDKGEARFFTRQGFGLMQNQWDFEAHRNFVEALQHDPECLGAYTGLLMLTNRNHNLSHAFYYELITQVDDLKKKRKAGEYIHTRQEILYAEMALAMAEKKKKEIEQAIVKLTETYKLDFQAHILKEIIVAPSAGGNSVEKKAKFIELMMKRYPYKPILWEYFQHVHAYNKDPQFIKSKILPIARTLVKSSPDIPVVQLKYAICLHKAGMHVEADAELKKALHLYTEWGRSSKIPITLNAGVLKVKIYQVMSLYRQGKFAKSIKLARELQGAQADVFSISEVRGINLWEVQTLPARLYLARGAKGDLVKARDSLPGKDFCAGIELISPAPIYYKAIIQYIAFRISIKDGMRKEAEDLKLLFDVTNQEFQELAEESASVLIDKSYFYRGKTAVSIYHNHVNAELERLYKDKQRYQTFMGYVQDYLDSKSSLSILPRHVIEEIPAKK